MKKSILFSMVAATAVLSVQAVDSANVIGVQPVTESETDYLLIAVPWNDFGTGNADVKVETLVNCDQLTTGDKLYVANGNKYDVYKVEGNQWVGCATATIGSDGKLDETTANPTEPVARGNAVWLYRQNKTAGSKDTFYIVGQKPTTELTQVSVAAGSNLISVPAARDVLVKNISGGSKFDQIIVPGNGGSKATYTYTGSEWKVMGESGLVTVNDHTISAGIGFWYVAKSATTITL